MLLLGCRRYFKGPKRLGLRVFLLSRQEKLVNMDIKSTVPVFDYFIFWLLCLWDCRAHSEAFLCGISWYLKRLWVAVVG